LGEQFDIVQGYLASEAQKAKRLDDATQQTAQLKLSLKQTLLDKLGGLRMAKYRIKQLAGRI